MTAGDFDPNDDDIATLHAEAAAVWAELAEARETLHAIHHCEVDGLIVETPAGPRVISLHTLDLPYREIVENINEGAATVGSDGVIIYANDRFMAMTGAEADLVVGRPFTDFLTEHGRKRFMGFVAESMEMPRREEFDLAAVDGSSLPVQVSSRLLPENEPPTICLILTDIAERKQAERELAESEERFHQLFKNMASGVAIYEPADDGNDFVFVDLNEAGQALSHVLRQDVIGRRVTDVFPGIRDIGLLDVFQRVSRTGEAERQTLTRYWDDRLEQWVENYVFRLPTGQIVALYKDMSDISQAEEALRKSEGQLANAVEIAGIAPWEYDATDNLFTFNDHFYRVFHTTAEREDGYVMTPDEYVRRFVHPDDVPRVAEAIRRGTQNPEYEPAKPDEHRVLFGDGTIGYITVRIFSVTDEQGRLVRTHGVSQDITDRRLAEEALRESEEKYRTLTENIGIGVAMISPEMKILTLNRHMREWFPRIDVGSHPVCYREFNNPPRESQCSYCPTIKTLQDGQTHQATTDTPTPEGIRNFRILSTPVLDKNGTVLAAIEMVEDVTARRRTESMVEARFALLEFSRSHTLEENLREALDRVCDMTGSQFGFYHFLDFNQEQATLQAWSTRTEREFCAAMEAGLHCRIEETGIWMDAVRRNQAVIDNEGRSPPHRMPLPEGQAPITRELVVPVARGDRVVALLYVGNKPSDYDDEDVEVVSYLADIAWEIAERKLAEAEHANIEDQLRQAQRMESIGRLAGGVAHDFNNLLTVILSYTSLLRRSFDAKDPVSTDVEEIHQAGLRAAELTTQLLAFSRKQIISPRVIDLNVVMKRSEKMLQRMIGEDIDLVFSLAGDLHEIDVDPGQMDQILVNLAVNARDAMPDGGKLLVETANVVLDDVYVRDHPSARAGAHVMLAVSDSGSGMDRETQLQIFEPFFTTKAPDRGTGLGLSTVYGIVKQSGGSIHVYSEVGDGTTFKIYLPVAERAATEDMMPQPTDAPRGRETILLIEDEDAVRKVARRILESSGYTILEAAHPGAALVIAEQHGKAIDMVLTDVVMPNMSGQECHQKLCEIVPDIKVLFMSGYTADAIAHRGVLEAGTHFIQKPFTIASLSRKVREVLGTP